MPDVEFVRIDGQPVRVTSMKRDADTGRIDLVIVARGSAAAHWITGLSSTPVLTLELPDEPPEMYRLVETDVRTTGEGEQVMSRVRVTLEPVPKPDTRTAEPEAQLDRIERKLDDLLRRFDDRN